MNLPQHTELHVVSDLHMGGDRPDFQILRETRRLADYVRWVTLQRPGEPVALVLNGDVVDTLAEDVGGYVAVDNAVSVVGRILDDPSFSPIWEALAGFVKTPNRTLVIVVGNHDIELALPPVQHLVLSRLAGDSLEARARIEFSTVGAGYTCRVGTARVFCTHGNEADPWNYVRYEDLSRAARRLNCGRPLGPSDWEPNAGTKLVKDVMNAVKRRYAWVDLLKPETTTVAAVLLVLDPTQLGKVVRLPAIAGRLARGAAEFEGRLGADGFAAPGPIPATGGSLDQLLGPDVARSMSASDAGSSRSAEDMLQEAELHFRSPRHGALSEDERLGVPRLVWDRLTGWLKRVGPEEALRRALVDWLAGDTTFDVAAPDDTFRNVTSSVGPTVDFVVTGHSHLERAIEMGGSRYYFNSGTWIRLLRLTDAMLKDQATFKPVYDVLANGTMKAIDDAVFDNTPFVLDRSSAVRIEADPGGVVGSLLHVDGSAQMVKPVREFVRR